MYNKNERKIIALSGCLFFMSDEFRELKKTYISLKNNIGNELLLNKISEIEMLLKEKIQTEILHSYKSGCEKAKESKKYFDSEPLISGIENNTGLGNLYNNSPEYYRIYNSIKEAENELCICVKFNTELSKNIDLLFEVYSDFSYELTKTAFIAGYSLNIPYSTADVKVRQSVGNEKEIMGAKLLYCRKYAKMTQEELGEKLNIDRSRLSLYENGKAMPSAMVSLALAEYFNIELNDLIDSGVSLDAFIKKYF